MAGDVREISDSSFKSEVIEAKTPVLVDFTAAWCAPCKAIAPMLEEFATKYKDKMKVVKVDVDANQQSAQQYGVRAMPTLLVFKAGKVVDQIVGAPPKAKLEDTFKKHV